MRSLLPFDYMAWAKAHQGRYRFDLSVSGMAPPGRDEFSFDITGFDLDGLDAASRAQIKSLIAVEYGVAEEQVVLAAGTSEANFLVCLTLLESGDGVLVENPSYQVLARIGGVFGAQTQTFERRPEHLFALDLDAIKQAWRPNTKLVALTSPHNPSGFAVAASALRELGDWLERHDAYALIDEVYRDFMPHLAPVAQAIHPRLLTTASLTKVYGLGALRAGWALMPAALVRRAEQLYDFMAVNPAAIPWRLVLQAWPALPGLRQRAQARAADNHARLAQWLPTCSQLRGELAPYGLIAFLKLVPERDAIALHRALCERYELLVSPGDYFGMPGWLRLAYGIQPHLFSEALEVLSKS